MYYRASFQSNTRAENRYCVKRLILLRPQNACVLGPDKDLTEDGVVVGTEDHLVIVDQADKFNGNFLQLFLNWTQSPRYRGQWLLMT